MKKSLIAAALVCATLPGGMTAAQAQTAPAQPMMKSDALYRALGEK